MHQIVPIGEIAARAKAIGLTLKQLAAAAGVAPSTGYRALRGADPRASTLRKLLRALETREDHVRRHLADLGGAPEARPRPDAMEAQR